MAAGSLTLPLLVWSLWSVAPRPLPAPTTATANGAQAAPIARPALRIAAFDAPLWTLDPPPLVSPTPPAPLRLQLVGIVRDGSTLKAVVYNQETEELAIIAQGESIGTRSITKIEAESLTFSDGRRLVMEGAQP